MTENLFERTVAAASTMVAGVRPEQYGDPTPCREWDVRALINHMIASNLYFAQLANGEPGDGTLWTTDHIADGDPVALYAETGKTAVAAVDTPEAGQLRRNLPNGAPGPRLVDMYLVDQAMHIWDLAAATGQDRTGDPVIVQAIWDKVYGTVPDAVRGPDGPFDVEQPCDPEAPLADRLAAYLGRKV